MMGDVPGVVGVAGVPFCRTMFQEVYSQGTLRRVVEDHERVGGVGLLRLAIHAQARKHEAVVPVDVAQLRAIAPLPNRRGRRIDCALLDERLREARADEDRWRKGGIADRGFVGHRGVPVKPVKADKQPVPLLGPIVIRPFVRRLEQGGALELVVLSVGNVRAARGNQQNGA